MNAAQFVAKWRGAALSEKSAAQQHYLDLCELFGFPKPADVDKDGAFYTFEKYVGKARGGKGFADVWYGGKFAWEYKKRARDLDAFESWSRVGPAVPARLWPRRSGGAIRPTPRPGEYVLVCRVFIRVERRLDGLTTDD